jgi:hypothetical protein
MPGNVTLLRSARSACGAFEISRSTTTSCVSELQISNDNASNDRVIIFLTEYVQRTRERTPMPAVKPPSRTATVHESANARNTRAPLRYLPAYRIHVSHTNRLRRYSSSTRRVRLDSFITVESRCQGAAWITLVPAPQRHYNGVQLRIQKSVDILFAKSVAISPEFELECRSMTLDDARWMPRWMRFLLATEKIAASRR